MFAIQAGSKFIKTEPLFGGGSDVYNVVITATPKFYKTKADAQTAVQKISEWVESRIAHAEKVIESTNRNVDKRRKEVARLELKLEGLLNLPFREVEKQVATVRKAIVRAGSEIRYGTPSIASYRQDLARYKRIQASGAVVVKMQQTVEAI